VLCKWFWLVVLQNHWLYLMVLFDHPGDNDDDESNC
jgi:hypothetical protein